MGKYAAPTKKTKEVVKDIMNVEFENTSKSKDYDDDGYEEGKSKDREISLAELMRDRPGSYAEASKEEISKARGKIRDEAKVGKGLK